MTDLNMPTQEREAIALVTALGSESAQRKVDQLFYLANERMRELCGNDLENVPHGFSAIDYLSDGEREHCHLLRLGLTLTKPDPATEAHQRIIARREAQRRARLALTATG